MQERLVTVGQVSHRVKRLTVKAECALALLPTLVVLAVFSLVEFPRLASLASSAFLIYLDQQPGTIRVRTLVLAHMLAASIGCGLPRRGLERPHLAGGTVTITAVTLLDAVHPPTVQDKNNLKRSVELRLVARAENRGDP